MQTAMCNAQAAQNFARWHYWQKLLWSTTLAGMPPISNALSSAPPGRKNSTSRSVVVSLAALPAVCQQLQQQLPRGGAGRPQRPHRGVHRTRHGVINSADGRVGVEGGSGDAQARMQEVWRGGGGGMCGGGARFQRVRIARPGRQRRHPMPQCTEPPSCAALGGARSGARAACLCTARGMTHSPSAVGSRRCAAACARTRRSTAIADAIAKQSCASRARAPPCKSRRQRLSRPATQTGQSWT